MKKIMSLIICLIMSTSLIACTNNSSKSVASKEGKDKKDVRIVGGSIAVSEILARLDIKMVGRVSTNYEVSNKIKDLPQVGLPMNPDLERIKALKSDVYIASGALEEMIGDKLRSGGINVEYCNLDSYDSVKKSILDLSKKYGKEENGKELIKEIEKKEKVVMKEANPNKKVKVMILFGAPGHFMLATKNSFTGNLIDKLGGENIANKINLKGEYVPFSLETALQENPDVIFRMYHGYIDEAKKQTEKEFKNNPQWQKFKAVKENKVYDLDPKYFGVTGDLKIVDSLEKMKNYLYK